jgi:hypothetical protein
MAEGMGELAVPDAQDRVAAMLSKAAANKTISLNN